MKIKKINAFLSLVTILALLVHVGCIVFSYLTFIYDPVAIKMTARPFLLLAGLHAILGMAMLIFSSDGTRLDLYPRQNAATVLQRISAILLIPLVVLHIRLFKLLTACAEGGQWTGFTLLMLTQPVFYGVLFTHVAVSVTRALVTLGWLSSLEKKKTIDRIVYIASAVLFLLTVWAVIQGELGMFLSPGGTS